MTSAKLAESFFCETTLFFSNVARVYDACSLGASFPRRHLCAFGHHSKHWVRSLCLTVPSLREKRLQPIFRRGPRHCANRFRHILGNHFQTDRRVQHCLRQSCRTWDASLVLQSVLRPLPSREQLDGIGWANLCGDLMVPSDLCWSSRIQPKVTT